MSPPRPLRHRAAGAVDVVVVGAGHSGLAMSRCLAERGIDHVVLERGEIANAWRHERWDSLRLLTPNWQTRLPGYRYTGPDPDGYMTAGEVAVWITRYAALCAAPVRTGTRVLDVTTDSAAYRVRTSRGSWRCRAVVIASGAHERAVLPAVAAALPQSIVSLPAHAYRNPQQLDERGVLIVGASATGVQLAEDIHAAGRTVTLAVGEHVRMPRLYRGRDVQWWLEATGILDERYGEVDDLERARGVPSPQLVGSTERRTLDLNTLAARGVRIVGRLAGLRDGRALFSGALRNHCALADLKLGRLLERFDAWAERAGLDGSVPPPERATPTLVPASPTLALDLARARIGTILWATGFAPDYSWLRVPVLDAKGRLRHDGGVVASPGLYVLGLNFMRRRRSSYLHGAESDARELTAHLAAHLRHLRGAAPNRHRNSILDKETRYVSQH
jgi:putative flavoprotein involved in K+ transport